MNPRPPPAPGHAKSDTGLNNLVSTWKFCADVLSMPFDQSHYDTSRNTHTFHAAPSHNILLSRNDLHNCWPYDHVTSRSVILGKGDARLALPLPPLLLLQLLLLLRLLLLLLLLLSPSLQLQLPLPLPPRLS
jgi:hypothetical protein